MNAESSSNLPSLPTRIRESHKGDFGRALLIGGSTGMAGAISLAGIATLRSGAGLVSLATPASVLPIVASFEPSYMTIPLAEHEGRIESTAFDALHSLTTKSDAFAVGPGLGRNRQLTQLVSQLYRKAKCPAVFDADALNALADSPRGLSKPAANRVITPHLGEFRRLAGDADLDRADAIQLAKEIAAANSIVVVVKGPGTTVIDGQREYVNNTGNPGLASGGTGDVLTGIICGLLAQGMPAFEAAVAGVHLHGLAGDITAEHIGEISMIASDVLAHLPQAIRTYAG